MKYDAVMVRGFAALVWAWGAVGAEAPQDNGTVVSVRNRADACPAQSDCRTLDFGSAVVEGDSLKTFDQSRLVVRFGSGSRAEMGPNSLLILSEVKQNGKKSFARWGEFDFEVKNKDSKGRFQVRTPVAVAGAQGTRFKIRVDAATGESTIELLEGALQINPATGSGAPVFLGAGQRMDIREAEALPVPTLLNGAPLPEEKAKATEIPVQAQPEKTVAQEKAPPPALEIGTTPFSPQIAPPPKALEPPPTQPRRGRVRIEVQELP